MRLAWQFLAFDGAPVTPGGFFLRYMSVRVEAEEGMAWERDRESACDNTML